MQLVEELLDMFVGEVRHHDGLDKCRVRLDSAFAAEFHRLQAFVNGGRKGFQQVPELGGHNGNAGVELHLSLELLEKVEDGFAFVFVQQVLRAGFRCDKKPRIGIGMLLEVFDEFLQNPVRDAGLHRRFLERFRLGREVVIMVPVLAAAQFHDLRLDFLLALRSLLDGGREILQKDILLVDILFGHRTPRFPIHVFEQLAHVQVVVLVSDQLLFMNAVGHQAVLAADIAALDGIDFERERRAAARVVMNFSLDLFRIDFFEVKFRYGNNRLVLDALHEDFRTAVQPLERTFRRNDLDS